MYKKRRTTKKGSRGWEISESEQDWPAWKILYVWLKTDANEELKANLYGEAHKEEEKKIIFVNELSVVFLSSVCVAGTGMMIQHGRGWLLKYFIEDADDRFGWMFIALTCSLVIQTK